MGNGMLGTSSGIFFMMSTVNVWFVPGIRLVKERVESSIVTVFLRGRLGGGKSPELGSIEGDMAPCDKRGEPM